MLETGKNLTFIQGRKVIKKKTYLTSDQRAELIEQCLDWFEDWKDSDPTCYPETREERKEMMVVLNNSDLIKHMKKFYCEDIFDYI